ncbi:MAG: hypothetical protein WC561_05450, partial [Candidatus Omnitrophota bacterium]
MRYFSWLSVVFISGIIFTSLLRINFEVFFVSGLLILSAGIIFRGWPRLFLCLAFLIVFILGALVLKISYILPADHIARIIAYGKPDVHSVEGYIASQPSVRNGRTT